MSAKEMFEKLGYELNDYSDIDDIYIQDNYYAIYVYEIREHEQWRRTIKEIAFFPNIKKVSLNSYTGEDNWSVEELKAINKQVEELGWNK